MKNKSLAFIALSLFLYGFIVGKYEAFPYNMIKSLKIFVGGQSEVPNRYQTETSRLFKHFNPKADIAFIGDSITNGGRWSEFFPDLSVVNRGVDGDKSSDVLMRLDSIISSNPTSAFLMVGINDIRQNVPVRIILENFALIVDVLTASNIEVIVQQTIQCDVEVCGPNSVDAVNELNKGLEALARKKGVSLLELGKLTNNTGLGSRFTYDGFHLSADGYIYWVQKISSQIGCC
jgi:hypothetical protein